MYPRLSTNRVADFCSARTGEHHGNVCKVWIEAGVSGMKMLGY